jgi:uroporphyrin-III C-methyltransferase
MTTSYKEQMNVTPTKTAVAWEQHATGFARLDAETFPSFEAGWVWLVGAGPGAPGLMSLLCYHAMQNCDVVVYDALVNPDILRWVRVGAELETFANPNRYYRAAD